MTVYCTGVYNSSLEIPDDIPDDEIQAYIEEHISDCSIEDGIEYVGDVDTDPLGSEIIKEDGKIIEVVY